MNEHAGPLLGKRDSLRVIDCRVCGYAHLETMPNTDDLNRFYASDFWTKEQPGALARIEEQRKWWAATYGDWLELVERHAPGRMLMLLDVGVGYGYFLKSASIRGWDIQGIEPSLRAAQYATHQTGTAVWCGTWEEAPRLGVRTSCISALWLIEHLPDPLCFLRWAHDRLLSGGVLLVVVPNDFTPIQRLISTSGKVAVPWWFIHHTHISYFTPVTLSNLLGRAGFRVVERTTMYPMEHYLYDGKDYTADASLGAELHGRVEARDLAMTRASRMTFYREMAQNYEGREIVMVAKRDD